MTIIIYELIYTCTTPFKWKFEEYLVGARDHVKLGLKFCVVYAIVQ